MGSIKKILTGFLFVFIAFQFIQPARNKSGQVLPTDIEKIFVVPTGVQSILQSACYDCHSNKTNYPWYSFVQPIGWMMAYHINNGKAALNFSSFGGNSPRKQISKLKEIVNQLNDDEMPLVSYKLLHSNARLSSQDKKLLTAWLTATADSLQNK
jgi:hypothetical protein